MNTEKCLYTVEALVVLKKGFATDISKMVDDIKKVLEEKGFKKIWIGGGLFANENMLVEIILSEAWRKPSTIASSPGFSPFSIRISSSNPTMIIDVVKSLQEVLKENATLLLQK